jgi:hypothetical protein
MWDESGCHADLVKSLIHAALSGGEGDYALLAHVKSYWIKQRERKGILGS